MRMKRVIIRPVLNGFIVEVGCQALLFKDIQTVAEELIRYWKNPKAVEEEYLKNAVNPPEAAEIPSIASAVEEAEESAIESMQEGR